MPATDERAHDDFDWRSPFKSYLRVTRDIIVESEHFFRAVRGGGYGGPTLFVLAGYPVLALLTALYTLPFFVLPVLLGLLEEGADAAGPVFVILLFALAWLIFTLVVFPIFVVLLFFVGAALWHPFVTLSVGLGRGAGFRETYRICAYSSASWAASCRSLDPSSP